MRDGRYKRLITLKNTFSPVGSSHLFQHAISHHTTGDAATLLHCLLPAGSHLLAVHLIFNSPHLELKISLMRFSKNPLLLSHNNYDLLCMHCKRPEGTARPDHPYPCSGVHLTLPTSQDSISVPGAVRDTAAGPVSTFPQPCPASLWALPSQAHVLAQPQPTPVPKEVPYAQGCSCCWCPPAALLLDGGWDGPWLPGSTLLPPTQGTTIAPSSMALSELSALPTLWHQHTCSFCGH